MGRFADWKQDNTPIKKTAEFSVCRAALGVGLKYWIGW